MTKIQKQKIQNNIIAFKIKKFNDRKIEKQKQIEKIFNEMIKDELYHNIEITELKIIY